MGHLKHSDKDEELQIDNCNPRGRMIILSDQKIVFWQTTFATMIVTLVPLATLSTNDY